MKTNTNNKEFKINRIIILFTILVCLAVQTKAQESTSSGRWHLSEDGNIHWNLKKNEPLPHSDHIAMSGQSVDMILEWKINSEKTFHATRVIRWPMLRTIPDDTHASLQRRLSDRNDPKPIVNDKEMSSGKTQSVTIHGVLSITSQHDQGVSLTRTIFPSVHSPSIIDLCCLKNVSDKSIKVRIPKWRKQSETHPHKGVFGKYVIEEFIIGEGTYLLVPKQEITYALVRSARKENDAPYYGNPEAELAARHRFIQELEERLILKTPDTVLNQLFAFSKLRAAESIFSTRGGLMHAPGGYNKYLAAVWANDQAEYINPFFPFLGNAAGNESALNCFRHFAKKMNTQYKAIPSSIIAEGRGIWNKKGDRGDAAMIAYGASRFCLASGNSEWSQELWPLIAWCLEYSNRQKNSLGVISSKTDELEGRFPAGNANLCTSSLYYDALVSSAYLAKALGKPSTLIDTYLKQAKELRIAIRNYFEADVEGFATYQYYEGNTILRSWICIPLTVGIESRLKGTVDALLSDRLWTPNGVVTKAGTKTVWDRSTLYALRGILASEEVDRGLEKLQTFSRQRLLGDHVPYVIEAYPEQNKSHLSAESGLYCRIFTEGLFGIRPTGLHSFKCTPRLPAKWPSMTLHHVHAFGTVWNIKVSADGNDIRLYITDPNGAPIYNQSLPKGKPHHINLYQRIKK